MPRDIPNIDVSLFPDNEHIFEDSLENKGECEKTQINEIDLNEDPNVILSNIRKHNLNRLAIGHLNINFVAEKFEAMKSLIKEKLDIFVLTETKIDESFPSNQFLIDGFSPPFRLDRDKHGGGVLIYISENVVSKELKWPSKPKDVECIFLEINLRKQKWILMGGYNPKKESISYFLDHVSHYLDKQMTNYDNLLILGDFNSEMSEKKMSDFCETYDLCNLITDFTCYKNVNNPSSIDVILTNKKDSFNHSMAIETGLSDHHKMVVTVLKSYCKKQPPQTIKYRCYRNFNVECFRYDLFDILESFNAVLTFDQFNDNFMKLLDFHAPMKSKKVRGNNAPFMSKRLSKEIMHRSKLKNAFNKNPTEENKQLYKRQRNYCVSLLRKEKRNYYNKLDLRIFESSRKFWQKVRPLFSDKQKSISNISILENNIVISNNVEVAEKLNNFFADSIENLEIEPFVQYITDVTNYVELDEIIKRYKDHPSVLKIKENIEIDAHFSFEDTNPHKMGIKIRQLDPKKASVENDIPSKLLIETSDIVSQHLSDIYNNSKFHGEFPQKLKRATIIPISKSRTRTLLKKDYRPVSLLPVVSKLYEKDMADQIKSYMDKYLSPYLFGYRANHSSEQCLTVMLEAWKKALDCKYNAGAVLTDLSKAFDCLNHDLLIAKLNAYGFRKAAIHFIYNYLKERKHRTKINNTYSNWRSTKLGVPQGSILGPLLFNIFINDIFFFLKKSKIANYADDNTAYATAENINGLLTILQEETTEVLKWFQINEMKPNDDKCHLFVGNQNNVNITLGSEVVESENSITLLGINIDNRLNFENHVLGLIRKGNQKLHALARISKYMDHAKLRILMKTFIESQFNYCPLVWMFHSRTVNNKINKLHERALRLVYKNVDSSFQELLNIDNSKTVHQKNLQRLAIEMYKVKNNIAPLPMQELFIENSDHHSLRSKRFWNVPRVRTTAFGTETIRFRGPKIWENLPLNLREAETLPIFKSKIKDLRNIHCTCRLCKDFVPNLGFLQ